MGTLSWLLLALQFFSLALAAERSLYIVHMDKSAMPRAFATHRHWYSSAIDSVKTSSDPHPPKLVYSYDNVLHGFSAVLSEDELEALKKSTGFVSAYKDHPLLLHTTYTPNFLDLNLATGLLPASKSGEDAIIGLIDSGVWPESKSFSDHGMPEIPKRWKGICRGGWDFNSSLCNRKLIGANYFNAGLRAQNPGLSIAAINSARDLDGHGSLTASIAGGNYTEDVSYFEYAPGTAKGVAPRARLAVYKALWREGAYSADLLAAMNQAVSDGVDVISISIGLNTSLPFYADPIAIAAFGAMTKGVLVSASAGNQGPRYGIVENTAPWMLTVAAGSTGRWFAGSLTLGNGLKIRGWSLFPGRDPVGDLYLLYDQTISACTNYTQLLARVPNPGSTILICLKSEEANFFRQMGYLRDARLRAAIFINDDPDIFTSTYFPIPGTVITPEEGEQVISYAKNGKNSSATITFRETYFGNKPPAPSVAAFSSRGPAQSNPGISKPDIMAPGVLVLAASPPFLSRNGGYDIQSGTSMACPHVSGIAAMLKSAHPDWSPSAIRSAMMTTAITVDNTGKPIKKSYDNLAAATPLDMGAGLVDPNRALDPGLVYDATPQDYVNFLCTIGGLTEAQFYSITQASPRLSCFNGNPDLNYPSFIALYSPESREFNWLEKTFKRTVTNVGPSAAAKYKVKLEVPNNSTISVSPETLIFGKKNEKQSYTLRIRYRGDENKSINMGSVTWVEVDGNHNVRSPIVVAPSV